MSQSKVVGAPSADFKETIAVRAVVQISRAEFFTGHLVPRVPLIVSNIASGWRARSKWTWEWLSDTFGDAEVLVVNARQQQQPMRLAEYLKYVLNPDAFEIQDGPLYLKDLQFPPELCLDYSIPNFIDDWFADFQPNNRPPYRWFYIGPKGTGSRLHIDTSGTHAWMTQITGEKQWRLFSSEDLPLSYCGKAEAFNPDPLRFPAFKKARCFTAKLTAGDTIFVPAGWLHEVRNLGPSWALSENFCNASNAEDVYRHADGPTLRAALTEVCSHKAFELCCGQPGSVESMEAELLHAYFANREREFAEQLAAIRGAKEALAARLL